LREAATWQARFAILDETFACAATSVDGARAVAWAWRRLAESHGTRPIEALARDIGWSRPHFTQRFRCELGVTPKTAARIFRFERACRVIKDTRAPLAGVAAACGYHDQAHLTREWNAMAGCTPRTWIARELPFLQDYELYGGDDSHQDGAPAVDRSLQPEHR
jgi:AraC-like DNA-binding protein